MDGLSFFDGKKEQKAYFAGQDRRFSAQEKAAYNAALLDLHILLLDNLFYSPEVRGQIKKTLDDLFLR